MPKLDVKQMSCKTPDPAVIPTSGSELELLFGSPKGLGGCSQLVAGEERPQLSFRTTSNEGQRQMLRYPKSQIKTVVDNVSSDTS